MTTIKLLKHLYGTGKITFQQYSTYKGQIKAGNEAACIVGMKRQGLIK